MDLVFPKMMGVEVLEQLRGDEKTKDIPVIVLTNSEDTQDIQRVMDLGATTYLVKSNYELQDVVKRIKTTLGENEG
jgi:CheY-like chemotaxis protein